MLLGKSNLYLFFTGFGRRLVGNLTRQLGWNTKPDEDHLTKLLRSLLLESMAAFDDTDVISEAQRRFDLHHTQGQEQIPPDFRSIVYAAVLRSGFRPNVLQQLFQLYRQASLLEEQDRIASALGTIENESALQEVHNPQSLMNMCRRFFSLPFCVLAGSFVRHVG